MPKKDNGIWIFVIIIAFFVVTNFKMSNQALSDISSFPDLPTPQKITLVDKTVSYSYTEQGGWNTLAFDDSSWNTTLPPFQSPTISTYSATYPGYAVHVCSRDAMWGTCNQMQPPSPCIPSTDTCTATNIAACQWSPCCNLFMVHKCSYYVGSGGWDLDQTSLYIRKKFTVPPQSPGTYLKIVPANFPDGSNGLSSLSENQFTLGESSPTGVCYVNGKVISISSIATGNHRFYQWGYNTFSPYVDISALVQPGNNVVACKLLKASGASGNFNYDVVTYTYSPCTYYKTASGVGESLPEDIPFQNQQSDRLETHWTICDYPNYYAYHTTLSIINDPTQQGSNQEYQMYGQIKGDSTKVYISRTLPTNQALITTDYPPSYVTLKGNSLSAYIRKIGGAYDVNGVEVAQDASNEGKLYLSPTNLTIAWMVSGNRTVSASGSATLTMHQKIVYIPTGGATTQIMELENIGVSVPDTCGDTDQGHDYFTQGQLIWVSNGVSDSKWDNCSDANTLNEGYCVGSTPWFETHTCLNGCSNGKCNPETAVLGDTNGDGKIQNDELLTYINKWTNNQATNADLLTVIGSWTHNV